MTELTIITKIAVALRTLDEFDDADVVDNDSSILDQSVAGAPYAIIYTSDNFLSEQTTLIEENSWDIPVLLVVEFEDWETSMIAFRALRQTVLDLFNENSSADNRTADGLYIPRIRSDSPIEGVYDMHDFSDQSVPDFLSQRIIFEVEEF